MTRLEQVINAYESKLFKRGDRTNYRLEKIIESMARERAKHPGLYMLSDLQIHIFSLEYFLKEAEVCFATSDTRERITSLVDTLYTKDQNGILHNPFLQVRDEFEVPDFSSPSSYENYELEPNLSTEMERFFRQEAEDDLVQIMPEKSVEIINELHELEEKVKILESKRMGLVSCVTILTTEDIDDEKRADMTRRLLRFWSGYKKSFSELTDSDAYGDFTMAINEVRKSKSKNGIPPLSKLPSRVCLRLKNYQKSTRGRSKWKHSDESHDQLSNEDGEEISSNIINDVDESRAEFNRKLIIQDLRNSIPLLPPAEQLAIEKDLQEESLSVTERKAKSRGVLRLKKMIVL